MYPHTSWVFILVNGFSILLLTPFYLYAPEWLNPLIQDKASEVVSSIALTAIFAFITGIPGLLLRERITGVNNWISFLKRKEKSEPPSLEILLKRSNLIEKDRSLSRYNTYTAIKYQIVNGLIVGSEIAFFCNTTVGAIILLSRTFNLNFLTDLDIGMFSLFVVISLIFGLTALGYDKKILKGQTNTLKELIDKKFNENSKSEK